MIKKIKILENTLDFSSVFFYNIYYFATYLFASWLKRRNTSAKEIFAQKNAHQLRCAFSLFVEKRYSDSAWSYMGADRGPDLIDGERGGVALPKLGLIGDIFLKHAVIQPAIA